MAASTQSFRRRDRTLRFSFSFLNGVVSMLERRSLEMIPMTSQDLTPFTPEERTGFWVEVQDAEGRALFRRAMPHPLLGRSEGDASESPRIHYWTLKQGVFVVTVPNLTAGSHLVLCGTPATEPGKPLPAVELLRVQLHDDPDNRSGPDVPIGRD